LSASRNLKASIREKKNGYIKNFKKPEPYKGKGLLLKNENILRKDGKKSKK